MRKSLCACVALSVLVVAAQAQAQAQHGAPSGFVDVSYSETDFEGFNTDTISLGGSAAVSGDPLSAQTWGVQGDARIGWTEVADDESTTTEFGAHLFSRSQSGLIGAFAGFNRIDTDVIDADAWTAGIEGLNFFDYVTVYGSVGYVELDEMDTNGWGGSLELRYFLEPNFRFDLGASAINGDVLAEEGTVWSVGFGAEYQLPDLPISGFANFDHVEFDNDIVDTSADRVLVGLRWNFDGNLLARDRSGPALPNAAKLARTLTGL